MLFENVLATGFLIFRVFKDGSGVSSKSLSDQDVMRAIGLGLSACGIQLAG